MSVEHMTVGLVLGSGPTALITCQCGEVRTGPLLAASESMREHEESRKWRAFMDDVLNGREVWIMGRPVKL